MMSFSWQYVLNQLFESDAQVYEVDMTKAIHSVIWGAIRFFPVMTIMSNLSVSLVIWSGFGHYIAILFDVMKYQILILTEIFYLCNLYFALFAM